MSNNKHYTSLYKWGKPLLAAAVFAMCQTLTGIMLYATNKAVNDINKNGINSDSGTEHLLAPSQLALAILISGMATVWIINKMNMIRWKETFRMSRIDCTTAIYAIAGSAAGIFSTNIMLELLGVTDSMEDTFQTMSNSTFCITCIAITGPVAEELIFREGIQGTLLRNGVMPWMSIVGSAIIFGIIHFNWMQTIGAACIGTCLAVVYWKTRSIILTCIIHIANNSMAVGNIILINTNKELPSATEMFGGVHGATATLIICLIASISCLTLMCKHHDRHKESNAAY